MSCEYYLIVQYVNVFVLSDVPCPAPYRKGIEDAHEEHDLPPSQVPSVCDSSSLLPEAETVPRTVTACLTD